MQTKLVVFHLDDQHFALYLSNVEKIIHGIEMNPLQVAPDHIAGTINYQGDFLPIVNIRKLFKLPLREIELTDQLIIAKSAKIRMALWVDEVDEIVTLEEDQIEDTKNILLDSDYVEGLFKLKDGLVLIHDLDKFLTNEQILKLSVEIEKQNPQLISGIASKIENRKSKI